VKEKAVTIKTFRGNGEWEVNGEKIKPYSLKTMMGFGIMFPPPAGDRKLLPNAPFLGPVSKKFGDLNPAIRLLLDNGTEVYIINKTPSFKVNYDGEPLWMDVNKDPLTSMKTNNKDILGDYNPHGVLRVSQLEVYSDYWRDNNFATMEVLNLYCQ
jgi:hypothetical protein